MPLYDPLVPARYARLLLGQLTAFDPPQQAQILQSAGIDPGLVEDVAALLPVQAFDALLQRLVAHTGRSDIGFELGLAISPGDHGPLSVALRRCTCLAEVMDLHVRYARLVTTVFVIAVRHSVERSELIFRPAAPLSPLALDLFIEIHAVSAHRALSEMFGGRAPPYDITLHMARPEHHRRYTELHPARVRFWAQGLPEVRVAVPASTMTTPLRWCTPPTGEPDQPLGELQHRFRKSRSWAGWARMLLYAAEHCQPSAADLASLLNVSAHTLARALAREGESFRELANRTRIERARTLLARGSESVESIAQRLGYANTANFSNAFRARTGETPSAYRLRTREPLPTD